MPTIYDYLREHQEPIPIWLERFRPGDPFPREEFFSSRVVYYPGAGNDGQPVKLFASTHSAHCFVYVDYHVRREEIEAELDRTGFRGYHTLARIFVQERELTPYGWRPHIEPWEFARAEYILDVAPPFAFLEVLERNSDLDDSHGARRFAVLFMGADGFAAYDALFCQPHSVSPPFAVVLQDHGFGGNWEDFGGGGLLERIAQRTNTFPEMLLVANNTVPWEGYERVEARGECGGMGHFVRHLYVRK